MSTAHKQDSQSFLFNNNNNNNNNNNKCYVPEASGEPVVEKEAVFVFMTIAPDNTIQYNYYVQANHFDNDNNDVDDEDYTMSDHLESFPEPDQEEIARYVTLSAAGAASNNAAQTDTSHPL